MTNTVEYMTTSQIYNYVKTSSYLSQTNKVLFHSFQEWNSFCCLQHNYVVWFLISLYRCCTIKVRGHNFLVTTLNYVDGFYSPCMITLKIFHCDFHIFYVRSPVTSTVQSFFLKFLSKFKFENFQNFPLFIFFAVLPSSLYSPRILPHPKFCYLGIWWKFSCCSFVATFLHYLVIMNFPFCDILSMISTMNESRPNIYRNLKCTRFSKTVLKANRFEAQFLRDPSSWGSFPIFNLQAGRQ